MAPVQRSQTTTAEIRWALLYFRPRIASTNKTVLQGYRHLLLRLLLLPEAAWVCPVFLSCLSFRLYRHQTSFSCCCCSAVRTLLVTVSINLSTSRAWRFPDNNKALVYTKKPCGSIRERYTSERVTVRAFTWIGILLVTKSSAKWQPLASSSSSRSSTLM